MYPSFLHILEIMLKGDQRNWVLIFRRPVTTCAVWFLDKATSFTVINVFLMLLLTNHFMENKE